MRIIQLSKVKTHSPEVLASFVDTILLHRAGQGEHFPKELYQQIDRLPSRFYILRRMSSAEHGVLFENIQDIWKKVTGTALPDDHEVKPAPSAVDLDGNFWMIPGGMLLKGFNHYATAKRHKALLCSLLDINPYIFEQKLHSDPKGLIRLIINHGGVRLNIDREKSRFIAQTNEESWPTVLRKFQRMYHKHKIARVLDPSQPYKGWKSGIPIIVNG